MEEIRNGKCFTDHNAFLMKVEIPQYAQHRKVGDHNAFLMKVEIPQYAQHRKVG